MIEEELLALEREAERRVREAGDKEIERGGPDAHRRASAAMNAPMMEAASIRRTRRRLGDLRQEIDHQKNVILKARQNPDLPSGVRRRRILNAGERLGGLAEAHRTLEAQTLTRFPQLRPRTRSGPNRTGPGFPKEPTSHHARPTRRPNGFNAASNVNPVGWPQTSSQRRSSSGERKPGAVAGSMGSRRPARKGKRLATNVAAAGGITLPGRATLRAESTGQATPIDLLDVLKYLRAAGPRAMTAVGAGLTVLLTPTNSQVGLHYFGEEGNERLRIAPGDLYGAMEKRDPQTGEWTETGEVGVFAGGNADEGRWYATGTPEQVDRALGQLFSQANDPFPQIPPLVPPDVPEVDEPEIFPAEERGPTIHATPADPHTLPDLPGFELPDPGVPLVEIFPDQSGMLDDLLILKRKGGPATIALNKHINRILDEIDKEMGKIAPHSGGIEEKETWFHNRDTNGLTGGSFLDITRKNKSTNRMLHINTYTPRADGSPDSREHRSGINAVYNMKSGDILVMIPKGAELDESALRDFLRPLMEEINDPPPEGDPRAGLPREDLHRLWRIFNPKAP